MFLKRACSLVDRLAFVDHFGVTCNYTKLSNCDSVGGDEKVGGVRLTASVVSLACHFAVQALKIGEITAN